jgi:hypothetical protein
MDLSQLIATGGIVKVVAYAGRYLLKFDLSDPDP